MKLFSKLKNVLFEEEEIEVPVEEHKVKIAPAEPPKKIEKTSFKEKAEEPIVTDRELFKAEKTFDFPTFDDNEFDNMKNITLDLEDEKKEEKKKESMSINLIDYEKPKPKRNPIPKEKKTEEIKGRAYPNKNDEQPKNTKFKPSPVISPVYGVLDKNYHKEDLIIKKDNKKDIDVDIVRKKAFGTLEEDLEKSLNKPIKEFYKEKAEEPKEEKHKIKEEDKSIEDLLEETSYDVIDVANNEEDEELFNTDTIELEQIDKPKEKDEEEKNEETLENDLFDLIDSMYDNKEEE